MRDKPADSSVEALDHAVGLRMPGWGEPVFDAELGTGDVEGMVSRGSFAGARESIRELKPLSVKTFLITIGATPLSRRRKSVLLTSD